MTHMFLVRCVQFVLQPTKNLMKKLVDRQANVTKSLILNHINWNAPPLKIEIVTYMIKNLGGITKIYIQASGCHFEVQFGILYSFFTHTRLQQTK